jgi:hypothetical protein
VDGQYQICIGTKQAKRTSMGLELPFETVFDVLSSLPGRASWETAPKNKFD